MSSKLSRVKEILNNAYESLFRVRPYDINADEVSLVEFFIYDLSNPPYQELRLEKDEFKKSSWELASPPNTNMITRVISWFLILIFKPILIHKIRKFEEKYPEYLL